MARLLVSVRSVAEAEAALAGGADLIDVKEPSRGPLGRADPATWAAIRAAVPAAVPVSLALGEWAELPAGLEVPSGIALVKVGLAGAGADWATAWSRYRTGGTWPPWVAMIYADAAAANAPGPDAVVAAALSAPDCAGVLVDTWDKGRPSPVDGSWADRLRAVRASGRFVALAGGLDGPAIRRLAPLGADWFAVRGAACLGGRRDGSIDAGAVADLARTVASL